MDEIASVKFRAWFGGMVDGGGPLLQQRKQLRSNSYLQSIRVKHDFSPSGVTMQGFPQAPEWQRHISFKAQRDQRSGAVQ